VNVSGSLEQADLVVAISSWTQALRRFVLSANTAQFTRLNLAPPVEPQQKVEVVAKEVMKENNL
jgi:hypothetical protein